MISRSQIKRAQKESVNFPIIISSDNGKTVNSIISIPHIGEPDPIGGSGIPEFITLMKENSNDSVTTAHYELVDVSSNYKVPKNDPQSN